MLKRTIKITFRLDKAENAAFKKRVRKSGLSQEAYIRHLLNGLVPQPAPPPDYFAMMRQLHAVGNSLNQIAQKAHTLNVLDVQRYNQAVRQFQQAVQQITDAVILPKPME